MWLRLALASTSLTVNLLCSQLTVCPWLNNFARSKGRHRRRACCTADTYCTPETTEACRREPRRDRPRGGARRAAAGRGRRRRPRRVRRDERRVDRVPDRIQAAPARAAV